MSFQWTPSTGLNDTSAFPAQDKGFRARLQALLDQAKNAINTKADIAHETPINPTLLNGWVNYGSGFSNALFFKDGLGKVVIKGFIKSGTLGQTIFTLPLGYRPLTYVFWPVITNTGVGQLNLNIDGTVVLQSGGNAWCSLENVCFPADL